MLRAVADIGSNTVKYSLFEYSDNGNLPQRVNFDSKTLRLIGRIKNGILDNNSILELSNLLRTYKRSAINAGSISFDIFATECIRSAENKNEICKYIEKETNEPVKLLTSEDEARLSYLAMYAETKPTGNGVCIDMGGGSMEIICFNDNCINNISSLPIGCVVLRKRFVSGNIPTPDEQSLIENYVKKELTKLSFIPKAQALYIMGGTAKALNTVYNNTIVGNITTNSFSLLKNTLLENKNCASLLEALIPERVDTAIPGLCALKVISEVVSPQKIIMVESGTREGFLIKKYNKG